MHSKSNCYRQQVERSQINDLINYFKPLKIHTKTTNKCKQSSLVDAISSSSTYIITLHYTNAQKLHMYTNL